MIIRTLIIFLLSLYVPNSFADTITCGDAMSLEGDARLSLHHSAQKRAQQAIETFKEQTLTRPYTNGWGGKGTPELTAEIVEVYWCDSTDKPLNAAYYGLYSSDKSFFEKKHSHNK